MIQANELRLGNFLNYTTEQGDILLWQVDYPNFEWICEDPKGFNLVHSPVPLTKQVLLDCGFREHIEQYSLGNFVIDSEDRLIFVDQEDYGLIIARNVKYLHQLQNIIFALTGTELEYKPKER